MARLALLRGRVVALALLVALLGATYLLVLQPIVAAHRHADEQIAHLEQLLEGFHRAGGSRAALQARLDQLQDRAASQTAYMGAASDALAAANLQEFVKQLVESNGGRLLSTVILPAHDDPPFRRIAIKVRIIVSTPQARQIFYALDTADLLLFVDNVHIRGQQSRPRRDEVEADVQLDVRFDLYGYMHRDVS
jgi:general secretion pathway protein M